MVNLPKNVTASPHTVFQQLDDEMILLNLETERYYELDDVGARMWQLLTEYDNTQQVIAQLLSEYEVDETTLRSDLANLISQLSASGLIATDES